MHELVDREDEIELLLAADANVAVAGVLLHTVAGALVAGALGLTPDVQNAVRIPDLVAVVDAKCGVRLPGAGLRRGRARAGLFEIDIGFFVLEVHPCTDLRLTYNWHLRFGCQVDDLPVHAIRHCASYVAATLLDVCFGRGAGVCSVAIDGTAGGLPRRVFDGSFHNKVCSPAMISVNATSALVVIALLGNLDTMIDFPPWLRVTFVARVVITTGNVVLELADCGTLGKLFEDIRMERGPRDNACAVDDLLLGEMRKVTLRLRITVLTPRIKNTCVLPRTVLALLRVAKFAPRVKNTSIPPRIFAWCRGGDGGEKCQRRNRVVHDGEWSWKSN